MARCRAARARAVRGDAGGLAAPAGREAAERAADRWAFQAGQIVAWDASRGDRRAAIERARAAIAALLARDPAGRVSLDDPRALASLLGALREGGARDVAAVLLARDPAGHVSLDDPAAVALLLRALREGGNDDAAAALATRAANAGMFNLFLEACPGEASRYPAGREPDGGRSQTWKWQEPARRRRRLRIRQPDA